jgi:uncharacterized protein YegP (UPF0339 family)
MTFSVRGDGGPMAGRLRSKAACGEIIAASEACDSKAAVQNGIAAIQKSAAGTTVVDLME